MGKRWGPTKKIYRDIEKMAAQGLNESDIAVNINLHPNTLSDKKHEFDEIENAIQRWRAQGVKRVTSCLMEQVESGNHQATAFYLKNRRPDDWHDIQSAQAIQVNLGKLTDTQLLDELRQDKALSNALVSVIPQLGTELGQNSDDS